MIDKEEIMWSVLGKQPKNKEIEPSEVLLCMDEYAKEVAIGFADWLLKNGYGLNSMASWRNVDKEIPVDATSEILFNQYLKSIK